MPTPSLPEFDLSADPGIQAHLADFQHSVQAMQAEMEAHRQELEAEAAVARQSEETLARPQTNAARLAEFERMEAEFSVPMEPHAAGISREIGHALETTAEELLVFRQNRPLTAERQWFYAQEDRTSGPVPEKELVKLLETGALPWSTLVWHRALADWKPVLETELAKIVGPGVPPPLPAGTRKAGQRATKNPVCPTCGSTSKAGDRFCAACGQPLSS